MAHDEEQGRGIRRSIKNRLTLSKTPIFGWWRPAWNLSFEARVGILADEHQNGHAPYDAVLDGFVDSGRFLRKQASTAHFLDAQSVQCWVLADLFTVLLTYAMVDLVI